MNEGMPRPPLCPLCTTEKNASRHSADFLRAAPLAALCLSGLFLLQRQGLVDLVSLSGGVGAPVAFLVGLIASVSACSAVVGGLTLSVFANFAKQGHAVIPPALFHTARLGGFTLFGGLFGLAGGTFDIPARVTIFLTLLVGLLMLGLGIRLLQLFPQSLPAVTFPTFLTRPLTRLRASAHVLTPLVLGAGSFFMPCGFTQTMQLYALTSGSFQAGATLMLSFALGTLPALAALSFTPALFSRHPDRARLFFRTSGLVVTGLALYNLSNGLLAAGLIPPSWSLHG